ncbi:MAG: ankyrin repeat domain-containing protein [Pyrinomonadaceae bacterium]
MKGKDVGGDTPLIVAARAGHDDVVQSLLVATADPNAKNDGGQTARSLDAAGRNHV